MNEFINKILREAEDSSDDFFQSKHITKRQNEFRKEKEITIRKAKEIKIKLKTGLNKIKASYDAKDWKNDKEKLFLEIFSKLVMNAKTYSYKYNNILSIEYGFYLINVEEEHKDACFYSVSRKSIWMSFNLIWIKFINKFNMTFSDVKAFMVKMLKKYFNLDDVRVYSVG